jgi:hypothetical protein
MLLAWVAVLMLSTMPSRWVYGQASMAECRPNPYLSRAKDQFDRLEFDRAAQSLQRAIEHAQNCKWDLSEVYRLKAFVDAVNDEKERCQRVFEIVLALNPDYQVPDEVPPKIRKCFEAALRVPAERRSLSLTHTAPPESMPSAPISIPVSLVDPLRLVDELRVYFRRAGVPVYTLVTVRADESVSLVIPGLAVPPDEDGYALEYFVRAVDRWGGTLGENGNPDRPLALAIEPGTTASDALVAQWWFWTIIGVAAASGVVAAVLATQSDDAVGVTVVDQGVRP